MQMHNVCFLLAPAHPSFGCPSDRARDVRLESGVWCDRWLRKNEVRGVRQERYDWWTFGLIETPNFVSVNPSTYEGMEHPELQL
jgi:hypothetical protein